MEDEELYKYLGYNQARILEHKTIKEKLKLEYTRRINSICKMQLSSKNLFKALNTYAIPMLTYSFGVVRWSITDINALEIKTRSTLTQHRYHYPKSAIERVSIPKKEGGRELIDIKFLHERQIEKLKLFFSAKESKQQPLQRNLYDRR